MGDFMMAMFHNFWEFCMVDISCTAK